MKEIHLRVDNLADSRLYAARITAGDHIHISADGDLQLVEIPDTQLVYENQVEELERENMQLRELLGKVSELSLPYHELRSGECRLCEIMVTLKREFPEIIGD